ATRENAYFGKLRAGDWSGHFVKQMKFSRRYSPASRMQFTKASWESAWNDLRARLDADQLDVIKRTPSGDVLSGEIVLDGHPVQVIVKRPRKKLLYRYVTTLVLRTRGERMWTKAWKLYIRNIPAEFPLLLMQKRILGYVTDEVIVFERTPGATLAT